MCKKSNKTSYILHFYYNLFIIKLSILNLVNVMNEYGKIKIKLDELIKERGISKNKLSHRAEMQRTQINNYCNNRIARLDIDVLARICTVLDCKIEDLLEFVPNEESEK